MAETKRPGEEVLGVSDTEQAETNAELDQYRNKLEGLGGPIEGFATDLIVCFDHGDDQARELLNELADTYMENVGAFFGKLFGDDRFAEIKMTITSRDVWKKAIDKFGPAEVGFIFDKMKTDPALRALLSEETLSVIESADFEATEDNLRRLLNTLTNPNNPDDLVFVQRAFIQGIDPLAAIGGYHRDGYRDRFPDVADQLLTDTRTAHHKGAMGIGYEASQLAKRPDLEFDSLSPREQAVVLWTNTAVLTELYGSELVDTPQEKWADQSEPVAKMIGKVLAAEADEGATSERLAELAEDDQIDFEGFHNELRVALESGEVGMDSLALFQVAVAEQYKKPGEVIDDPDSPMHDLFYADTPEYPYLTMSFQGEKIGVHKVGEEGGMHGHGEISMSLPAEIEAELFERFPFLDKNRQITLRKENLEFDIPISGPSGQYIYINEGAFFNDPDQVYVYQVDGEDQEVKPGEILDFLREKRAELQEEE